MSRVIFYRQETNTQCGPIALQIVLSIYGRHIHIDDLLKYRYCGKLGWSISELCESANHFGITTFQKYFGDICNTYSTEPYIILKNNHYVVVYKISKYCVHIADPQHGHILLKKKAFINKYADSIVLHCQCTFDYNNYKMPTNFGFTSLCKYLWHILSLQKSNVRNVIFLSLISTISIVFISLISRYIIDYVLISQDMSFIKLLTIGWVILIISSSFSHYGEVCIGSYISNIVKKNLLSDYFKKVLLLKYSIIEKYNVSDIVQRQRDAERVQSYLLSSFFPTISSVVFIFLSAIVLYCFDVSIFIITIIISVIYILIVYFFLVNKKNLDINLWETQTKCNKHLIEAITRATDIRLFNMFSTYNRIWDINNTNLNTNQLSLYSFVQKQDLLANIVLQIKSVVVLVYSCSLCIDGAMTTGSLFAIQYISGMLNSPLMKLSSFISQTQIAQISVQRICQFEKEPEFVESEKKEHGVFIPHYSTITLDNVFYKYFDGTMVIRGFSMRFCKGQKIGIVGQSGCGKSTLLKLLCGLIQPHIGEYYIGNMNSKTINWEDIHKKEFSVMLQDNGIFEGTILDNIICSSDYSEDRLVKSVEIAAIRREIEILPSGYRTIIESNKLSIGQRQRILIARTIYKTASVYMFDEIGNGLSNEYERKIVEKIDNLYPEALRIYVTHRVECLKNADAIIVMNNGKLADIGKHEQLIERNNYYKSMI